MAMESGVDIIQNVSDFFGGTTFWSEFLRIHKPWFIN